LTQAQLAESAGVGRWKVVDLEAGRLERLTIDEIDLCLAELDARLVLSVAHHGAELDRLLDQNHAALVARVVRLLTQLGWQVRVEVTFNDYSDRGSIDVLGWRARERALLVIEVKSELGSIEGTLRPFAVKCRLAAKIAGQQFGWRPALIGRVLVLPEDRTARRVAERHSAVLDTLLPARSREVRTWLRNPRRPIGGIWFLSDVGGADAKRNPSSIRRVRRPRPRLARPG